MHFPRGIDFQPKICNTTRGESLAIRQLFGSFRPKVDSSCKIDRFLKLMVLPYKSTVFCTQICEAHPAPLSVILSGCNFTSAEPSSKMHRAHRISKKKMKLPCALMCMHVHVKHSYIHFYAIRKKHKHSSNHSMFKKNG